MIIRKFTDRTNESTLEEVNESKLIDKKFIFDNPNRVYVELPTTKSGYEFKGSLEDLENFMKEMLDGLQKDERDYIINSIT
jgi:hypothetical protein